MLSHPASYRDTSGFIFLHNGNCYRYIDPLYEPHYSQLMTGGLYEELVKKGALIPHREITETASFGLSAGRVLLPEQIPFISYPYEWSFDMWKDAALLTLQIAASSLKKGMMLKDATPFNIQFYKGKPVFIDTLSFENYEPGKPWVAYRQFCECFLAPLLLMHYCHPGTGKVFTAYPDGIPMDVLAGLLPKRSKWNLNTLLHVHLQVKISGKQNQKTKEENKFSKRKMELLIGGLERFVKKLSVKKIKTVWDDYYTGSILGKDYLEAKTVLFKSFTSTISFSSVIDLGANDGYFSLLLAPDVPVIATDADPNCINNLYLGIKASGRSNILPLVNDLTTPSPAIGWGNTERDSMSSRLKADLVLALALVHHLTIAKNIPFHLLADLLHAMGNYLIIEFVPKSDEKVKRLLQNRKDIFEGYNLENFRAVFGKKYEVLKEENIGGSGRVLFLMKRRG